MTQIHEVVLSAPGKNALGTEHMTRLRADLAACDGAPVLMYGADGCFSAGLNLREVGTIDKVEMEAFLDLLEGLVHDLWTYPGPLVAAVNGHAIAGGAILALTADMRIATADPRTRIGLNEVQLGLQFPPGIRKMVQDRIPRRHLETVILGAELLDPDDALAVGYVDDVVSDPIDVAREHLTRLSKHPRAAYAAAKRDFRADIRPTARERERFMSSVLPSWTSDDLRARINAILKK